MNRQRKLARKMDKPKTKQQLLKEKISLIINTSKKNIAKKKRAALYKVEKAKKASKPFFIRSVAKVVTASLLTSAVYMELNNKVVDAQTLSAQTLNLEDNGTIINKSFIENDDLKILMDDFMKEQAIKEREERLLQLQKERELETVMIENQYDKAIAMFSYYFNLNSYHIVKIARELTNDYKDFSELYDENVFNVDDIETRALFFVSRLYLDKLKTSVKEMGYALCSPQDDIEGYTPLLINNDIKCFGETPIEEFYLKNGMYYTEYIGQVCDLLDIDKGHILSVHYAESGKKGSLNVRYRNNFGGMKINGEHMTFPTPEAGIISFCVNLKKYEMYNIQNMNEFSGIYVNGSRKNPNLGWVENVNNLYDEVMENKEELFLDNGKEGVLLLENRL